MERNYGLDLLRMVSMIMIVLLHVLGHGGIIANCNPGSFNFYLAWVLEILAFCAVNCYALISGYVNLDKKFKLSNIITLWLQVVFYTVIITIIGYFALPGQVGIHEAFNAIFPILTNQYWYFTAYVIVSLISPFLALGINNLEKSSTKKILVALLILFTLSSILGDAFYLSGGYSAMWLAYLFLVGGYFKKYGLVKTSKVKLLMYYLICNTVTFLWFAFGDKFSSWIILNKISKQALIRYNSFTMFFAAVCLFLFFAKINVKNNALVKIIKILSPAAFSVYLIHANLIVWNGGTSNMFASFASDAWWLMIIKTLTCTLIIYLTCSLIDLIRLFLFKKIKVKELVKKMIKENND